MADHQKSKMLPPVAPRKRNQLPSPGRHPEATSAAESSQARKTALPLNAEDVLEESHGLSNLAIKCSKLNVYCDDCVTAEQLRERLIGHLKTTYGKEIKAIHPTFATAKAVFNDYAARKDVFMNLLKLVKDFVLDREVRPWMDKLHISTSNVWLKPEDFSAVVESTKKKPTILIAGSTSSGKSTFANALLGEDILPTSYNAATRVLCEIKHGTRKKATLHLEQDGKQWKETVDLSRAEGRRKFEDVTSPKRGPTFLSPLSGTTTCSRVEVFLPIEFLKDVTLVDSPGVTEDDAANSVIREITEQFQREMACGFIYILDATRAAEEAAQAGGLLRAVFSGSKDAPPPQSALFLLNKWDILAQEIRSEDDRQEFITRTVEGIQSRWPGFKRQQLLTMNSKLAGIAQGIGWTTDDMKKFIEAMKSMLPKGMHYMMKKWLRGPYQLMDHIEQVLEHGLRELRLPVEEMMQKRDEDWKKVLTFYESLDIGKAAVAKQKLYTKVSRLVEGLIRYLPSVEGYKHALTMKKSQMSQSEQENYDKKNVDGLVCQRFCGTICNYSEFQAVWKWANTDLLVDVKEATKELNMLKADVAAVNTSTMQSNSSSVSRLSSEMTAGGMTAAVAVAVPVLLVGVPLALAIGVVAAPIYAVVQIFSSIRSRTFRLAVEKAYKELVHKAAADNAKMLREMVFSILIATCPPIDTLLKEIPTKMGNLFAELKARKEQEKKDIPHYQSVLQKCQEVKGAMSKFQLELNVHTFSTRDLSWPHPRKPVASGSFGNVYKVTLPTKEEAALKEMKDPLTEDNSEQFMKELNSCRKFTDRNVVKYFGTVLISEKPFKLAILFEWCGGGTLADVITDTRRSPPYQSKGFLEGQRIVREMLSGLKYLHSEGILHRDLKPENIMMTFSGAVKLGDMGLAKPMNQVQGTLCGTLLYMAPEVIQQLPYNLSADMYSVGIMLWEIWNAKRAYSVDKIGALSIPEFVRRVANGDLRPNGGRFAAEDDGDLKLQERAKKWGAVARECWSPHAKKRLSAEVAYRAICAIN